MTHVSEFTRNGYRALTPEEGDALKVGETVTILNSSDGTHTKGSVIGMRREQARVMFMRSGHILPFDLDDPDLWADREFRDRRPPMATEDETLFVLVTQAPTPYSPATVAAIRAATDDRALFDGADFIPQKPASPLFNALKASTELNTLASLVSSLAERVDRLESLLALKVEA